MRTPAHPVIRSAASILLLLVSPASAYTCNMTPVSCTTDCTAFVVEFYVNSSQFVAPLNTNDPPRRQYTQVRYGDARFLADAILMQGGIRGFHHRAPDTGSRLMIVKPDGSARLAVSATGAVWTGTCRP